MTTPKAICLLLISNLVAALAIAQVTISGKVTGANNQALTGISVTVKNTNHGTSSDENGHYTLTAALKPGQYVLRFTGVGLKATEQAVTVGDAATYTANAILIEDALGLDEVIVTGTSQGTTRRQLGNYISTLKA